MKTFWIYFFIFLSLFLTVQAFQYFNSQAGFQLSWADSSKHLIMVILIAGISAWISPKKKKKQYK